MLEWEREIQKKKKRKRLINQEDQISELTFIFHGALSILTFLKMSSPYSPRKAKKKKKERKKRK